MHLKISFKIFAMLSSFVLLFALIVLGANKFLSYRVYLHSKKHELSKIAYQIEQIIDGSNKLTASQVEAIEEINNRYPYWIVLSNRNRIIYPLRGGSRMGSGMHHLPPNIMAEMRSSLHTANKFALFTIKKDARLGFESLIIHQMITDDMMLMIGSPISQITDHIKVARQLLISITLGSLVVIAFVAVYFAKMVSKRFLLINDATKRLALLDFSQPIALKGNDELSDLAANIDWLSEQLKQSIALFGEQNSQLQADLSVKDQQRERIKKFISMLSHELKSPLFIIQGYSELLMNELPPNTATYHYTQNVSQEADKMSNLVSNMLHLAQLSAPLTIEDADYNLTLLVNQIAALYRPLAEQKEIKIDVLIDRDCFVIGQIMNGELILRNYISNALAHAKAGSHITLRLLPHQLNSYCLEVENIGQPITQDDPNLLWQPFYKGDQSRNRMLGGTGLGLSLVAAIQKEDKRLYGYYNIADGVVFWATFKRFVAT